MQFSTKNFNYVVYFASLPTGLMKSILLSLRRLLALGILLDSNMLIDPIQYNTMPHQAVLWLKYPVVLIWKGQELALYSLALEHIEGSQSLTNRQSVVQLTMDHELWCSPVLRKPM